MATITETKVDIGNLPAQAVSVLTTGEDDFASLAAQEMAMVHNVFTWSWNSIYQQAPHIVKKDYPDFIHYALLWAKVLKIHHDGEEDHLYPDMAKFMGRPDFFKAAVDEHEVFHGGFERYTSYLEECTKSPDTFSGHELTRIMDSFGADLFHHLNAEPHLLLTLKGYDDAGLRKIWDDHAKATLGGMSMVTVLPLLWCNLDETFEDGVWAAKFPPMPAPVKWAVRNIPTRFYSRYWRFGSTTWNGKPKPLLALQEGYGK